MIGICGASGFIGLSLYNKLVSKGETVLGTFCNNFKPGMVRFDLRKDNMNIFDQCEYVIILSAYCKIKYCQDNPAEAFWLNVYKTSELLFYLNEKGIPALFVSSDAAVKEGLRDMTYGKYKKLVEKYIKKKKLKADFIRPGKIDKKNIQDLCEKICEQVWAYRGRKE